MEEIIGIRDPLSSAERDDAAECRTFYLLTTGHKGLMPLKKSLSEVAKRCACQQGNLYALVPDGKALAAQFGMAESYPLVSVGFAVAAIPAEGDGAAIADEMKCILADEYAIKGVPAELAEAAKRQEIAGAEFERN